MGAEEDFQRRLVRALGRAAVIRARPRVVSSRQRPIRVLQRALRFELLADDMGQMQIPHYWAVYVHDGRSAPFGPRRSPFLIWFKNPRQDPRLQNGVTPERYDPNRRLTKEQFNEVLRIDAEARRNDRESPVVITTRVRRPTRGTFFFSNAAGGGMYRFLEDEAGPIAEVEFKNFAFRQLRSALGIRSRIPTLTQPGSVGLSVERESVRIDV